MAEPGGPAEIGAINIGITADSTQLDADLKAAEAKVAQSSAKMGQSSTVKPRLFTDEELGRVKEAKQEVDNLGSSAGMTAGRFIGLALRFTALTAAINIAIKAGRDLLKMFDNWYSGGQRTRQALVDLQKQIERTFRAQAATGIKTELESIEDNFDRTIDNIRDKERRGQLNRQQAQRAFNDAIDARQRAKEDTMARDRQATEMKAWDREREIQAKVLDDEAKARAAGYQMRFELDEEAAQREDAAAKKRINAMEELGRAARERMDRNPITAIDNQIRDQQRAIVEAWKLAANPTQRTMIEIIGKALVGALEQDKARIVAGFREAIGEGITQALQQQANAAGVQNTTILLRDIGLQVQSIRMTIPREYTGPVQGIAGM